MAKDRDGYKRSRLNKKSAKGAHQLPTRPANRLELFSKMSTEALQAISETRQEMKKDLNEQIENKVPTAVEHMETDKSDKGDHEQRNDDTEYKTGDDKDSAIGTSSMKSQQLVTKEPSNNSNNSVPEQILLSPDKPLIDETVEQFLTEEGLAKAETKIVHADEEPVSVEQKVVSPDEPKDGEQPAVEPEQTPVTVQKAWPPENNQKVTERQRPATVCANSSSIKRRLDSRYSLQSSQWIQECIKRHPPTAPVTIEQNKKMNVFERLSAPSQTSYKISARQRARARLSIAINNADKRNELLAFNQRREPHRETCKSPFPTITRLQRSLDSTKLNSRRHTTCNSGGNHLTSGYSHKPSVKDVINLEKVMVTGRAVSAGKKQNHELIDNPKCNPMHTKLNPYREKPTPLCDDTSEVSIQILGLDRLNTIGPFEITPEGYDSRYAAMKKSAESANWDFEECEMIRQSKLKCRQWLSQQMAILSRTSQAR